MYDGWCMLYDVWCITYSDDAAAKRQKRLAEREQAFNVYFSGANQDLSSNKKKNNNVWCMMYDVWCMMYDVWCLMYDVWCMMYDVWCKNNKKNKKKASVHSTKVSARASKHSRYERSVPKRPWRQNSLNDNSTSIPPNYGDAASDGECVRVFVFEDKNYYSF